MARDSNNRNRWGDYSGAVYDWTTGHFWGAVEYAGTGNTWRTRIHARTAGSEAPLSGVDVAYPNGGQTFDSGDLVWVSWASANIDPTHEIYVYLYDSGTYHFQAGPLTPGTTALLWSVPSIATASGQIWVGVWNGSGYVSSDFSDQVFTIVAGVQIFTNGFESGDYSGWSSSVP